MYEPSGFLLICIINILNNSDESSSTVYILYSVHMYLESRTRIPKIYEVDNECGGARIYVKENKNEERSRNDFHHYIACENEN